MWTAEVQHSYRSQCRPATGTASQRCNTPTGANASSMYRDSTPPFRDPILENPLEDRPGRGEAQAGAHALTWAFVGGGGRN